MTFRELAHQGMESVSAVGEGHQLLIAPAQFFGPQDKKCMAAFARCAARIPEDAEVVAVVQLDLRAPGRTADHTGTKGRQRVGLVPEPLG